MGETSKEDSNFPEEFMDRLAEQAKAGNLPEGAEPGNIKMPSEKMAQIVELGKVSAQEVKEITLPPRELTSIIIETLKSEVYTPSVDLYRTFSERIKTIPEMKDYAQEMEDAAIDTSADLELMTEIAELGLKGEPIKVIHRSEAAGAEPEDRSFLYLGPRTNQEDVDPSTIRTIEQPTPEQLNGLLLRTVENRTRNAMSMVQVYPEIALMSAPEHPKTDEVNSFIAQAKQVTGAALQLEKLGYRAMRGEPVGVTFNSDGKQILAVNPPKR